MNATDGQVRPLGMQAILPAQLRSSGVIAALVLAPDGRVLATNDCFLKFAGWTAAELVGKNARTTLFAEDDWRPWAAAASAERASGVELALKARDGRAVHLRGDVELVTAPNGRQWLSGLFVDTTAAKHLESSISHASRMEALAGLTSGIAHDFSNLLTVLVGNLYLISEGLRGDAALFEKAKLARDAAKRGIDLVRQLLSFARNEWAESPTVDPRKIIGNLEPLLKRALGARITLVTNVAHDVSHVSANTAQLESAIVNLVINARDATETGGEICVEVANTMLDGRTAEAYGVAPGGYVRIAVRDQGAGIPEALLGRVFEPFFSTKGSGKGSGLGLSMVRLFAVQTGGTVLLTSKPAAGTTVTILLPRAAEPADVSATNTMPLSALPGGKEAVFVFAEDEDVRRTVEQILSVLGYQVTVGSDFEQSVAAIRSARPQLVLIDIKSVKGSPGLSLLQAVRRHESLRAVIIRDTVAVHHSGIPTLQKPFDLLTLATTVRRVLDGEHDAR